MTQDTWEKYVALTEATWRTDTRQRERERAKLGLLGSCGEFAALVKRHHYMGRQVEPCALIDKLGDILWYLACLCRLYQWELPEQSSYNGTAMTVYELTLDLVGMAYRLVSLPVTSAHHEALCERAAGVRHLVGELGSRCGVTLDEVMLQSRYPRGYREAQTKEETL